MRLAACAAALSLLVSASAFAEEAAPPPPPAAPPAAEAAPPPAAPPPAEAPPAAAPVAAAAAPAPAAPATPPPPPWNTVMKEELLVDSYYMYNFSGQTPGDKSRTAVTGRNYDNLSNSFTLSYAKFALEVDADPVTVRADLGYGTLASLISGAAAGPNMGQAGTALPSTFAAQQAYASLKVPGTQLSIDLGRFNTTAGAEVIEANRNWIYSRSMLFAVIPVTHTGLRLNFKVNDMVSLQGSVVNGLANDQPDNNAPKTLGLSVGVNPLPTTSVIATTYFGKEGGQGATGATKITGDLVVSHNVSDALGLNLNLDYIKNDTANLIGVALMARYVAGEHIYVAGRGEFLKDKGIYLDADGQEYEVTGTLGMPFAGHLEIRAEFRGDFAKNPVFNQANDPATADPKKSQVTGTLAFLGFIQ